MAGQWPKAQVDSERKRLTSQLSAVAQSNANAPAVSVDRATATTIREALSFALESLADIITAAERNGQRTTALTEYRADIQAALDTIKRQLR